MCGVRIVGSYVLAGTTMCVCVRATVSRTSPVPHRKLISPPEVLLYVHGSTGVNSTSHGINTRFLVGPLFSNERMYMPASK